MGSWQESGCSEGQWDLESYGGGEDDGDDEYSNWPVFYDYELWEMERIARENERLQAKEIGSGDKNTPKGLLRKYPEPEKVEQKCKNCKSVFYPRVADVKRGWGKFCSKSCKAKEQTRRTGVSGPTGVKTRIKAGMRTKQDRP